MTTSVSKAQTFRNVIYNSLSRGILLICQLLTSMVVARNLSPSDMGVVGFALIIIGFLNQFSDCGVESAAVRQPPFTPGNLETAVVLKVFLGFLAFFTAVLIAPMSHYFCDHLAVANFTRFLSLSFLINTISFFPVVRLTREMNYRAQVIPNAINALVRCLLAITLILYGWKFWAVVLADVGANLASNLAFLGVKRVRFGVHFERVEARSPRCLPWFGVSLLGAGLLTFAIFSMDNFLVSATMGIAMLGYYALAFNWGSFVCNLLAGTVNGVLFPTFAAIQHDLVKLRRWYLKTIDLVAFIAIVVNTTSARQCRILFWSSFSAKARTNGCFAVEYIANPLFLWHYSRHYRAARQLFDGPQSHRQNTITFRAAVRRRAKFSCLFPPC